MRLLAWSLVAILGTASLSAVIAQNVEGLDTEAVRTRSAQHQADAQAFVNQVKDRGDALRKEALVVREGGTENMKRMAAGDLPRGPVGAIDFDEIVAGAATNANAKGGEAPQFIVFASLSMPPASLKRMIQDTARAGGVVVFRGFPNNSMKEFASRLGQIVEDRQAFANIGIDPRLFRAFDVQAVPTYVVVSSDFDLCAGFDCRTKVPPFDRMSGNVTVDYALNSIVDGNGPGARIAAVGLSNMKKAAK